ncbi:MAG: TetR family transcriptional regulator [Cereibacter sphaeroides]|uniref:TetR family transcriptional regulator n=1 Tax=Cereibacter sphaeroides TaxID=1063 RepID=A0A2W5SJ52_CERSP|nr:MAG: TetR family transcriptional regulator [Cereibacter sphaeroides]
MTIAQPIPAPSDKEEPARRKQSREERRSQLIEATLETLATRGYARTTLTEVAKVANLSHGLVNFHFETKEKLLAETLQFIAEEYRLNWTQALAAAGSDPADQLDAMLRADFNPAVCTPAKLSAWCSFWGEAQSRPMYQECCGSNDEAYIAEMEAICAALIKEGGYSGNPARVGRVLRVTVEGVWLDLMTMTHPYERDEALATVFACAAAFFPRHFGETGRI